MTVTRDLLTGFAALIATAGLGVWNPDGVYALTDTGIFLKTMPDGAGIPDRVIVLNVIPLTDQVVAPDGLIMLQVACRGLRNNPLDVDDVADPIFDLIQNATYLTFGETTVVQVRRTSSVPMGQDANVRWERADKYYLDYSQHPTNLRPSGGWD